MSLQFSKKNTFKKFHFITFLYLKRERERAKFQSIAFVSLKFPQPYLEVHFCGWTETRRNIADCNAINANPILHWSSNSSLQHLEGINSINFALRFTLSRIEKGIVIYTRTSILPYIFVHSLISSIISIYLYSFFLPFFSSFSSFISFFFECCTLLVQKIVNFTLQQIVICVTPVGSLGPWWNVPFSKHHFVCNISFYEVHWCAWWWIWFSWIWQQRGVRKREGRSAEGTKRERGEI